MRYKAIAPAKDKDGNLCYNEKTCGVQFARGVAHFDDVTIDKSLGWTAEEIADIMEKDFGYEIQKLNDNGTPYLEPETAELAAEVSVKAPAKKTK